MGVCGDGLAHVGPWGVCAQTSPAPHTMLPQHTAGGRAQVGPVPAQLMQMRPSPHTPLPQHTAGGRAQVGPAPGQFMQTSPPPQAPAPQVSGTGVETGVWHWGPCGVSTHLSPSPHTPLPQHSAGGRAQVDPPAQRKHSNPPPHTAVPHCSCATTMFGRTVPQTANRDQMRAARAKDIAANGKPCWRFAVKDSLRTDDLL